jgi:hypothetical protein
MHQNQSKLWTSAYKCTDTGSQIVTNVPSQHKMLIIEETGRMNIWKICPFDHFETTLKIMSARILKFKYMIN